MDCNVVNNPRSYSCEPKIIFFSTGEFQVLSQKIKGHPIVYNKFKRKNKIKIATLCLETE